MKTTSTVSRAAPAGRWVSSRLALACAAFSVLAIASLGRAQSPGLYVIDSAASRIEIDVFRGGLFGGFADNHVIRLTRFSGTAQAASSGAWTVEVAGEAGSLVVMDPGAAEETKRKVQEKMLGPAQMDVDHYPRIELKSRSATPGDSPNTWRLLADVTVHGVTQAVEFELTSEPEGNRLRVQGKKTLKLRDFGIEPIRLGMGTVKVRNEFDLVYDLVLERK
jgi:polyisoprenoid-binding protein YceI